GAGWGRAELSISLDCGTLEHCNGGSQVAKPNLFGWVAGGGLEFKVFEHVRLRGEYLHYDFGSTSYSFQEFPATSGPSAFNFKTRDDVVRGAFIWNFYLSSALPSRARGVVEPRRTRHALLGV